MTNESIQATTVEALGIEEEDIIYDLNDKLHVIDVSEKTHVDVITDDEQYSTRIAIRNIGICDVCNCFTVNNTVHPHTDVVCAGCTVSNAHEDILNTLDGIRYKIDQLEGEL